MDYIKKFIQLINRDINQENESKTFTVVLRSSYCMMLLYLFFYLNYCMIYQLHSSAMRSIPWVFLMCAGFFLTYRIRSRYSFIIYTVLLLAWAILSVYVYGWDCGTQHFMIPLLIMCFFSVKGSAPSKFAYMIMLIVLRLYLYTFCQTHTPLTPLTPDGSRSLQILNTTFLFTHMGIVCLIFSTAVQESERKLLQYNQKLQTLASTDPLTGLPNRRYMLDLMEKHIASNPSQNFCIALGDIDHFKIINDTRGHNCGDEVLKSLGELFRESTKGKGYVCRWGGEEFFFFLPGMNLDMASIFMSDLNIAVSKRTMYDEMEKFHITMTFGLEENDFRSGITELIHKADDKLYYGKNHGRNQIVF